MHNHFIQTTFYNNCIYLMLTIAHIFLNCRMQNNFASPQLILQYCKTDYSGDINSIKYLFNMMYGYLQAVIIKRLFLYSNNDPFLGQNKVKSRLSSLQKAYTMLHALVGSQEIYHQSQNKIDYTFYYVSLQYKNISHAARVINCVADGKNIILK